jgi:hypothetical protein
MTPFINRGGMDHAVVDDVGPADTVRDNVAVGDFVAPAPVATPRRSGEDTGVSRDSG